jgi:exo-beta-1,3-glucanase (GH17 family)/cellulose synthase/poly-beta-1,6-N-acetylglucosamine synthase-like glycosyltransferase
MPSREELDQDLKLVSGQVNAVRTYSVTGGLEQIPELAQAYGLEVTIGAWLDKDKERNELEIANAIKVANQHSNVKSVIVGNEALLRGDLTVAEMIGYLDRVRAAVKKPVSMADTWDLWKKTPELVPHVDFLAIHILPYWEGIGLKHAVAHTKMMYDEVQQAYPGKHIAITEVGWPSSGRVKKGAVASPANQAAFLRQFLNFARTNDIDYFIMEAFDQPWKAKQEGGVGAYWGIFDEARQPKFAMSGTLVNYPSWPYLVLIASLLAAPAIWLFTKLRPDIRSTGRLVYTLLLQVAVSYLVWVVFLGATQYFSPVSAMVFALNLGALAFMITLLLCDGVEMTEVLWADPNRRNFRPFMEMDPDFVPKVSIHVPICNEPPEMVAETIRGLHRLDYPKLEVLVISNNTADPAVWKPIEKLCAELGDRFRFFHLEKISGFKAGALNFALQQTAPDADIIGVVDSDYVVESNWLNAMIPYFRDETVGFVQAPQDNRDGDGSIFKSMCHWEYAGFFQIGMIQRNERNAIIQHGTMTLIRGSALRKLNGWAEWCICEDSELGLRLMKAGYQSVYIPISFGKGLNPDSFLAFKKQRYRWAFGAMQILRGHARELFSLRRDADLTFAQRYHFLVGWFPWIMDAMSLLFTTLGLLWTVGLLVLPKYFEFPLTLFIIPTLGVFVYKVVQFFALYGKRVPCSRSQKLGAAVAGLALTYSISCAVLAGLFSRGGTFMRTPKCEDKPAFFKGFLMAREEWGFTLLLWLGAFAINAVYGTEDPEARIWALILIVQSTPFVASVTLSMINALEGMPRPAWLLRRVRT